MEKFSDKICQNNPSLQLKPIILIGRWADSTQLLLYQILHYRDLSVYCIYSCYH